MLPGSAPRATARSGTGRAAEPSLARADSRRAAGERRVLLVAAYVREHARCACSGSSGPMPIDPRQPLSEMGLDSLMAVELRNMLGRPRPEAAAGHAAVRLPDASRRSLDFLDRELRSSSDPSGSEDAPPRLPSEADARRSTASRSSPTRKSTGCFAERIETS